MNEITEFNFEGRNLRTVLKNNEPWFIASDVCHTLGLKNVSMALVSLDSDEKTKVIKDDVSNNSKKLRAVNESGLYGLIFKSKKKEAKKFRKWVTSEVLPTIRKHGAYMTDTTVEKVLADPDLLIGLAQNLKAERKKRLYAEHTKQCISDKKTATSMGRLSGMVRREKMYGKKIELLENKNKKIFKDFSRESQLRKISSEIRSHFSPFAKHSKVQVCSFCKKKIYAFKHGRGIPGKVWTDTVHDKCFEQYVLAAAERKIRNSNKTILRKKGDK